MRVGSALATVAVVMAAGSVGAGCGADDTAKVTPRGTAIRTIAPETTLLAATTEPLVTAYPTLPPVTATPPPWVPTTWRGDDVDEFGALVAEELEALGAEATVYLATGYAVLDSGTRVSLVELAQQLAAMSDGQWRAAVADYLFTALAPASVEEQLDFSSAGPLLRVKVGEPAALGVDPANVIGNELVPGLWAFVVFEAPDRMVFVTPEHADRWGRTAAELVLQAASQTLAIPEAPSVDGLITSLTDDSLASARILDPRTVTAGLGPSGALVMIPNTNVFLALAVDPTLDAATLAGLRQQAQDDFHSRANPASDDVYWWHDGVLEVVPFVGDQPQYPEALRQFLAGE